IMPTPGAVMKAAQLLHEDLGDLVVVDVGGATTDIHSVCRDSEEINRIQTGPEPFAKRTVEGDLGVFLNKDNLIKEIGIENIQKQLALTEEKYRDIIDNYTYLPTGKGVELEEIFAGKAFELALERHAGKLLNLYHYQGSKKIAEGKDLTGVKFLIATGGALTQLPHAREIIAKVLSKEDPFSLRPKKTANVLIDRHYLMASLGVLSSTSPEAALLLLKKSLR
ncbi:MAG: DNA mismatch repair protein MutL, partial [Acholeplasmataceae bacterium]|nr:DNA mismatch repair protein MutL [Acholeplasmataceae bacterium]